jgi:hypothetical protein
MASSKLSEVREDMVFLSKANPGHTNGNHRSLAARLPANPHAKGLVATSRW